MDKIIFSDETLRDGEQQVGINFRAQDKYEIAKSLASAGVDHIAIMPAVSRQESELSRKLLASSFNNLPFASTMLGLTHVDHSANLGFSNIILFASLSKKLMQLKSVDPEKNIENAIRVCEYARSKGMKIIFAGEDVTRADLGYVKTFIGAIEDYIEGFIICDTVGVLKPIETEGLVDQIRANVNTKLGAHFHDDQGYANENTVIAVKNGVEIISSTVGGIGERAGNADTVEVAAQLDRSGIPIELDLDQLIKTRELVYKLGGGKKAAPYSEQAFWHESGIHVDCLLRDPLSYSPFLPESLGKAKIFFYGKFSGSSAYRALFGEHLLDHEAIELRDHIKQLAMQQNRSFTEQEVVKIAQSYFWEKKF